MIKNTRIYLQTTVKSYLIIFFSFFFRNLKVSFLSILKKKFKKKNILLVSQGRVGLYLICKNILLKNNSKKNEFIISPYTLPEVLNAIRYAGGKVKFVDIDINTGLPCIKETLKALNKNTAAIIITHLYANKESIKNFFKIFRKQILVEDCAINFGAKISQKYLGFLADYSFFSFGTMKNICLFNGGLIYSKKEGDYKRIIKLENELIYFPKITILKKICLALIIDIVYNKFIFNLFSFYILKLFIKINFIPILKFIYPGLYPLFPKKIPINYKYKFFEPLNSIGKNILSLEDKNILIRKKNVQLYQKYLIKNNKILIFNFSKNLEENVFLEFPIIIKNTNNKKINDLFLSNGYDLRIKWYLNSSKFIKNSRKFPRSDYIENHIICLPTNPNFKEHDIIKISNLINNI
jgi:dTDP-4-amino-4,6-dideoxygalactose transaminase